MEVIKITDKLELKAVKHLYNTTSRDDTRPVLTAIKVEEELSESADGFMLNTVETPECLKPFAGKLIRFVKRPVGGINEVEIVEGTYPDTTAISGDLPDNKRAFVVNATMLVELLKDLPKSTFISIEPNPEDHDQPIRIHTAHDNRKSDNTLVKSSMVIMPCHSDTIESDNLF